ncbi:hypothetical protein ACIA5D_28425 [Actinoplanes sp. NPDC051513]
MRFAFAGAPTKLACHSVAGSNSPVSKVAGALHGLSRPCASPIRTRQW